MKQITGFVLCLIGTAALILSGVLWTVEDYGTDASLYESLQLRARADLLEYAGISREDLSRIDKALAECLKGDENALSGLEAEVFGQTQPAFNARELTHMEDCRKLFELARQVRYAAMVFGSAALALGLVLLRNRRRSGLAVLLGPFVLAVPLGLLAVWASVDFNAAFNFFHEVLFTNDLWLLDPDTDLLIRICPQQMFMDMGRYIGGASLKIALMIPSVIDAALWIFPKLTAKDGDVK